MIAENVINPNKRGNIHGTVFHVFYPDLHKSILFDKDMEDPIIHGSKNIVMTHLKKINELMNVSEKTKITIHSYIITSDGYRRTDTYNGPIETIGKYIKRI